MTELITNSQPELLLKLQGEKVWQVSPDRLSLAFSRHLQPEEAVVVGRVIYEHETVSNWFLGDWILAVEKMHGDDADGIIQEALCNPSLERVRQLRQTAIAFPPGKRNLNVQWSVHRSLNRDYLEPEEREQLLEEAEAGDMDSRQVEQLRNEAHPSPRSSAEWDLSKLISEVEKQFERIMERTSEGDVEGVLGKWRNVADEWESE